MAASLVACTAEPGSGGHDEQAIEHRHAFVDTSAAAPLAGPARAKMLAALQTLDRVAERATSPRRRALAQETLARIEAGDVKLGSLAASRGFDRWRMCKALAHPACAAGEPPPPSDATWGGDASLTEAVLGAAVGFTSRNRLYFTLDGATSVTDLASTLVHEVNHVLNNTDCVYFADYTAHVIAPEKAFVEEYRAFLAECLFARDDADAERCHPAALEGALRYDFDVELATLAPAGSAPAWLAEQIVSGDEAAVAPYGRLTPTQRRFPETFPACGTSSQR